MICTHLAQREVVNKGRGTVRLSEGEGRGGAGNFDASTTVLGSDLGLEGPPVLWVCVDSLKYKETKYQFVTKSSLNMQFSMMKLFKCKSKTKVKFWFIY